ncbi:DNA repair protein RecO, partial [Bifidobacterium sp.]|uniref:DNA repair protein RecO n=1 Tax=Bifidobacterium sp. TaxID=41200 RepID=UPI0025C72EE0
AVSIGSYAAEICLDFDAYSAANVIVETADKLVSTEHERARDQYLLVIGALNALSKHAHEPLTIARSYVMRALAIAGWAPRLDSCVVCARRDELAYFSTLSGGMMCLSDRTPDATRLSPEAYRRLRALIAGDWSTLDEAGAESTAAWAEDAAGETHGRQEWPAVARIVEEWGEYYLERPIRSLRLLHS